VLTVASDTVLLEADASEALLPPPQAVNNEAVKSTAIIWAPTTGRANLVF
jgi:hypothetical protein